MRGTPHPLGLLFNYLLKLSYTEDMDKNTAPQPITFSPNLMNCVGEQNGKLTVLNVLPRAMYRSAFCHPQPCL